MNKLMLYLWKNKILFSVREAEKIINFRIQKKSTEKCFLKKVRRTKVEILNLLSDTKFLFIIKFLIEESLWKEQTRNFLSVLCP